MTATELRIGNWVYDTYYEKNKVIFKTNYVYIDAYCDRKRFTPIPLTEEWLLRFWFVPDSMDAGNVRQFLKGVIALHLTKHNGKIYLAYLNCADLSYVHQLQNLYHSLTQKELVCQ